MLSSVSLLHHYRIQFDIVCTLPETFIPFVNTHYVLFFNCFIVLGFMCQFMLIMVVNFTTSKFTRHPHISLVYYYKINIYKQTICSTNNNLYPQRLCIELAMLQFERCKHINITSTYRILLKLAQLQQLFAEFN